MRFCLCMKIIAFQKAYFRGLAFGLKLYLMKFMKGTQVKRNGLFASFYPTDGMEFLLSQRCH